MPLEQSYSKIHSFLFEISDALRYLVEPAKIMETACEKLAMFINADQIGYAEINLKKGTAFIERDWNNGKIASNAGYHSLKDFGNLFIDDLKSGNIIAISDVSKDTRTSHKEVIASFKKVS